MSQVERQRELRRRRHRKTKLLKLAKRSHKASNSEKAILRHKLRLLTPGAEDLIVRWGLEER